eukprot:1079101-Alexandrium_andersonii.AAC.1
MPSAIRATAASRELSMGLVLRRGSRRARSGRRVRPPSQAARPLKGAPISSPSPPRGAERRPG